MHNDVVTSSDQLEHPGVKTGNVSDTTKTGAHKAVFRGAKVASPGLHKDAKKKAQKISCVGKTGVHKAVSNTKIAVHGAGPALKNLDT